MRLKLLLWSLCCMLSLPSWAQAPIRVATEHWPGYTSADGSGAYFELLHMVLGTAATPHISVMSFARAVIVTERNQADVVFAVTAKDSALLLRSNYPMDWDRIVAVYRRDNPLANDITQGRINRLRLSWRIGYNYGVVLGLDNKGYEALTAEQGVQLVQNKRLDVFLSEEDELKTPVIQQLMANGLAAQAMAIEPIFVGFAPSATGRALKLRWDNGWQQLQGSAKLNEFYQRHPGMRVPATE